MLGKSASKYFRERPITMAKKSKKKVSAKKIESEVIKDDQQVMDFVTEDPTDNRVAGLHDIIEMLEGYGLGDMDERFAPSMDKLVDAVGSVANRLAKALEVQAVSNAKKAELKAKLLARAEAH